MPWNNTIANFRNSIPAPRTCFIVGATGEVGKFLVQEVLNSSAFDQVRVISRRSLGYTGPNQDILEERIIEDFGTLETEHEDVLCDCQFGFCALGTTRAKAGSAEEFRRVDYEYIVSIGRMAKASGCRWFGLVSAAGASSHSSFLYSRTKGDTENALIDLELPHLFIYRPGLLLCDREEWRMAERVAGWFAPLMNLVTRGRAAIATDKLAKAMVNDLMETVVAEARGDRKASVKIISNQAMLDSIKLAGLV